MKKIILGEACEKIGSGATPRGGSEVYLPQGEIALIRSQNIYNDGFKKNGLAYITEVHAKELDNVAVEPDDILLNITGDSVARCCQVPDKLIPARVNQHVAIIRPRKDSLDARYLRYYLVSPTMQDYMLTLAGGGATRNALTKGMIESFEIPAPPLPEQRAIAGILGALDDKIELNRRMNATLESMARAVFRQWFVESEEVGNWEVGKFNDISSISREAITPNQFPDETFNYYSIPAFDEKQFPEKELGIEIKSNKFLVPNSCVLISKLNPEIQRIWIPFQIEGRSICSTEFLVNMPKSYFSLEYLLGLFSSQPFQDRFTSLITGTSGSHQRVKAEYLLDMDTQIPPKKMVVEYTETVKPLLQKVQQNILESRTLASLRDSLLPKLMRGEVRVKAK